MSLPEQLTERLTRLETAGTMAAPHEFEIEGDNYRLSCQLSAVGTLGCALSQMTASGDALQGASLDELKSVSESLASKLTYLLEPVAPIEVDQEGCLVQMRSDPPHREADERVYYELLVRPGQVSLRRFRKENRRPLTRI